MKEFIYIDEYTNKLAYKNTLKTKYKAKKMCLLMKSKLYLDNCIYTGRK